MINEFVKAVSLAGMMTGLSPEFPSSYTIDVRLDTAEHRLYGSQMVRFMNPTSDPLDKIAFHLYPNAFSDTNSVFCSESRSTKADVASGNVSRLDVSEIAIDGKRVDSSRIEISGTLMYISLRDVIPPEREIEISCKFELLIPRAKARFGHNGKGDYLLAHWYPILCGYQAGRLIDGEYHANGEFFSNFGSYDVTLRLPPDLVVGATGNLDLLNEDDTLSIWHASADTVIDFAFACGRNFKKFESDTLGIKIEYLLAGSDTSLFERVDKMTKYSLVLCSERLFPYPYDKFEVVDFDSGSPGLELPGMIIVSLGQRRRVVEGSLLESLIAHETAHEWFYAAIASNEADEPWLDEGFATYFENTILESLPDLGPEFSVFGFGLSYDDISRIFALSKGSLYPIGLASYDYPGWMEYESAVYTRANMVLRTLEQVVGDTLFAAALRRYSMTYRFGHPSANDFKRTISDFTGRDLSEFYSQFIDGTARVDYAVTGLRFESIADEESRYMATVDLRRVLDGILPQTVSLILEDGSIVDSVWSGRPKVTSLEFKTDSKPLYAAIDQHAISPLDEQLANNRLYIQSHWIRLISFDWDSAFLVEVILALFL